MIWRVDRMQALQARAEARAIMFRAGMFEDYGEAVWPLLVWAAERELEPVLVEAIVNDAFKEWVNDCNR